MGAPVDDDDVREVLVGLVDVLEVEEVRDGAELGAGRRLEVVALAASLSCWSALSVGAGLVAMVRPLHSRYGQLY